MPAKKRRPASYREADLVSDDLRREDPPAAPPEELPPELEDDAELPLADGGFSPSEDGGNPQHPTHDEDAEDDDPSAYEREIDRVDETSRRGD